MLEINPGFKCWKEIQVCGGEESRDTRTKEELSEGENRSRVEEQK